MRSLVKEGLRHCREHNVRWHDAHVVVQADVKRSSSSHEPTMRCAGRVGIGTISWQTCSFEAVIALCWRNSILLI